MNVALFWLDEHLHADLEHTLPLFSVDVDYLILTQGSILEHVSRRIIDIAPDAARTPPTLLRRLLACKFVYSLFMRIERDPAYRLELQSATKTDTETISKQQQNVQNLMAGDTSQHESFFQDYYTPETGWKFSRLARKHAGDYPDFVIDPAPLPREGASRLVDAHAWEFVFCTFAKTLRFVQGCGLRDLPLGIDWKRLVYEFRIPVPAHWHDAVSSAAEFNSQFTLADLPNASDSVFAIALLWKLYQLHRWYAAAQVIGCAASTRFLWMFILSHLDTWSMMCSCGRWTDTELRQPLEFPEAVEREVDCEFYRALHPLAPNRLAERQRARDSSVYTVRPKTCIMFGFWPCGVSGPAMEECGSLIPAITQQSFFVDTQHQRLESFTEACYIHWFFKKALPIKCADRQGVEMSKRFSVRHPALMAERAQMLMASAFGSLPYVENVYRPHFDTCVRLWRLFRLELGANIPRWVKYFTDNRRQVLMFLKESVDITISMLPSLQMVLAKTRNVLWLKTAIVSSAANSARRQIDSIPVLTSRLDGTLEATPIAFNRTLRLWKIYIESTLHRIHRRVLARTNVKYLKYDSCTAFMNIIYRMLEGLIKIKLDKETAAARGSTPASEPDAEETLEEGEKEYKHSKQSQRASVLGESWNSQDVNGIESDDDDSDEDEEDEDDFIDNADDFDVAGEGYRSARNKQRIAQQSKSKKKKKLKTKQKQADGEKKRKILTDAERDQKERLVEQVLMTLPSTYNDELLRLLAKKVVDNEANFRSGYIPLWPLRLVGCAEEAISVAKRWFVRFNEYFQSDNSYIKAVKELWKFYPRSTVVICRYLSYVVAAREEITYPLSSEITMHQIAARRHLLRIGEQESCELSRLAIFYMCKLCNKWGHPIEKQQSLEFVSFDQGRTYTDPLERAFKVEYEMKQQQLGRPPTQELQVHSSQTSPFPSQTASTLFPQNKTKGNPDVALYGVPDELGRVMDAFGRRTIPDVRRHVLGNVKKIKDVVGYVGLRTTTPTSLFGNTANSAPSAAPPKPPSTPTPVVRLAPPPPPQTTPAPADGSGLESVVVTHTNHVPTIAPTLHFHKATSQKMYHAAVSGLESAGFSGHAADPVRGCLVCTTDRTSRDPVVWNTTLLNERLLETAEQTFYKVREAPLFEEEDMLAYNPEAGKLTSKLATLDHVTLAHRSQADEVEMELEKELEALGIEPSATSSTGVGFANTEQAKRRRCNTPLSPIYLLGRVAIVQGVPYTICSACGGLAVAAPSRYITGVGYYCARHPIADAGFDLRTGTCLPSPMIAAHRKNDPSLFLVSATGNLRLQNQFFITSVTQLNGIPGEWLTALGHETLMDAVKGSPRDTRVLNRTPDDFIIDRDLVPFDHMSLVMPNYVSRQTCSVCTKTHGSVFAETHAGVAGGVLSLCHKHYRWYTKHHDPRKKVTLASTARTEEEDTVGLALDATRRKHHLQHLSSLAAIKRITAGGRESAFVQFNTQK
jgi:hypothetical protein